MQIIETNLSFGSLSKRGSTSRIILHHAEATSCTAEQIHSWHKSRGWSGAGYHFLVRKDGNVYRLRPEWAIGAHASGANSNSLGICFEGSFMRETMGQAQINAGRELVAYLKSKYGISTVLRHKDVGSTDCPGTNFPFDAIKSGSGSVNVTTSNETTNEASEGLAVDGQWGQATTRAMQTALGTTVDGIVSAQPAACKKYMLNCLSSSWKWVGGNGSQMVRALQAKVGADVDGKCGAGTVRSLQGYLNRFGYGLAVDGYCGNNTVRAVQDALNKGRF